MYICPFCKVDMSGNHGINCPLNPINMNKVAGVSPIIYATYTTDSTYNENDYLLNKLKQSGKRLKELLGITNEDIDRAIREVRKETI